MPKCPPRNPAPVPLARLRAMPDGVIEHRSGRHGQIVVAKQAGQLFLVFCPLGRPLSNDALSGVMARRDLSDPEALKGAYTQAMLASLAFVPHPRQVYIMGAGGGRLAGTLSRLLPDCRIRGSELDAAVLDVSRRYFGLTASPNLRIDLAEGRDHLARQRDRRFDHIYIDCYDANGLVPRHLSTVEFFVSAASKLAPGGVACINLIDTSPDFPAQVDGFLGTFSECWEIAFDGTHVLFGRQSAEPGADSPLDMVETLQSRHGFGFDLVRHVSSLRRLSRPLVRVLSPLSDQPEPPGAG